MKISFKLDRKALTGIDNKEDAQLFLEWLNVLFEQLCAPAKLIEHVLLHGITRKVQAAKDSTIELCNYEEQFLKSLFLSARIPPAANGAFCQYLQQLGLLWSKEDSLR